MRQKNLRQRLLSALLIASVFFGMTAVNSRESALASSAREIKNDAEQKLKDTKDNIDKIQGDKSAVENDISDAGAKLSALLAKQRKLREKISNTQDQVNQANKDLKTAQDRSDQEYVSMKKRIQFMYENGTSGGNSIFSTILESTGITDLLNRIEYVSDVYKSDRRMLKEYQNTVKKVTELTENLNEKMDGLLSMQEDYEEQQSKVEQLIAGLQDKKDKYASQLAEAEKQAQEYKDTIAEQARIIQRQEAEAARRAREEEARRRAEAARQAEAARKKAQEEARRQSQSGNLADNDYQGGGSGNSGNNASDVDDGDEDPEFSGNVSGSELVSYALQFVGNPYVWGGNSLTNGCDCSGFVHLVYKHFGYDLPRYSQSFKTVGKAVSYNNIKAGDIVVYPGHVAICIGNGCIVEAQSTRAGITRTRPVNCNTISAIRRVL